MRKGLCYSYGLDRTDVGNIRPVYTTPVDPLGPGFFFLAYLYRKEAKPMLDILVK